MPLAEPVVAEGRPMDDLKMIRVRAFIGKRKPVFKGK
jgi:hypothetical protein